MNPRRLAVFGLVVILAVVLGVLVRRYVMEREASAPEAPATAQAPASPSPSAPAAPTTGPEPAPAASAMPAPPEAESATRPVFDVVRVEPGGEAVIAGRAAPDSEVELLAGGEVIDRTKANEVGEFVMMPPPLQPGSHELTLRIAGATSRQAVSVSVPQRGKGEVLVVVGEPGKPSQVVQAGAPIGPTAGALPAAPGTIVSPAAADTPLMIGVVESEAGQLFVQGSGPPGARAMIYLNEAPVADARIGADGKWSLTVNQGLSAGSYKIRVDQLGADGKVVARAEVPFTAGEPAAVAVASIPRTPPKAPAPAATSQTPPAAAPAPAAAAAPVEKSAPSASASAAASPTASEPQQKAAPSQPVETTAANPVVAELSTLTVKRGDNLWRISRKVYGQGIRYSTIYQANTNQIRDPHRIYPGQIFVMPPG